MAKHVAEISLKDPFILYLINFFFKNRQYPRDINKETSYLTFLFIGDADDKDEEDDER